jgi:hypothetical protein
MSVTGVFVLIFDALIEVEIQEGTDGE